MDFAAVAEACGALGLSVGSDAEFEPALREALEAGRPALIHLAVDPRWTTPDAGLTPVEIEATPVEPEIGPEPDGEVPPESDAEFAAEPEVVAEIVAEPDAVPVATPEAVDPE